MILKGSQRGGAVQLAQHLMNVGDNEHVETHELRGFVADDLRGAFKEIQGISLGTRCRQFMFSLSLSPPEAENVPVEVFEAAIAKIEAKMGLNGQPRAIVFHEKKGRRHAHCVWSRIDVDRMKAINLPHFKLKLCDISRQLYLEYGWQMPPGLQNSEDRDRLNTSAAECQQARRAKHNPRELKRLFLECWAASDSRAAFANALKSHGLILARGDRRGHVAVDENGEVYAISRWVGARAKQVRAKLGDTGELPSVDEAADLFDKSTTNDTPKLLAHLEERLAQQLASLEHKRQTLVAQHRQARSDLIAKQSERRVAETIARAARLPTGLKAAWNKLSGRYQALIEENARDFARCEQRDKAERHTLTLQQLNQRRELGSDIEYLRQRHASGNAGFRHKSSAALPAGEDKLDSAARLLKTDPSQQLIIAPDPDALTIGARVRENPVHIMDVISDKKECFTRTDVLRALANHIDDPAGLRAASDQVMRSSELVEIKAGLFPQYSTHSFQNLKASLTQQMEDLACSGISAVSPLHVEAAIIAQNRALQRSAGAKLSDEQDAAIRHVLGPNQLVAVVGLAGAGKSTMLAAANAAWTNQGTRVIGAALSGKAADGLESASNIASRTLSSLERSWEKGFGQLSAGDVLVIDEAGMIGTRQLARITDEIQRTGAKLVLVGDSEQLQPIYAGTPFKEITQSINVAPLTEVRRQKSDWQKQATKDLAEQNTGKALQTYDDHGMVKQARDRPEAIMALVEDYMSDLELYGTSTTRLALAHRRKDVHSINQAIRMLRKSSGDLLDEALFNTDHGPRAFAEGDRILLTRNDHALGLRNGMIGTVKTVGKNQLTIEIDDEGHKNPRTVTIDPASYTAFDHGYATTIHKSQGATVDQAYILGSTTMDRHLTYVAMSRHREDVRFYAEANTLQKLKRISSSEPDRQPRASRHERRRPRQQ